jgi:hypothetical protein
MHRNDDDAPRSHHIRCDQVPPRAVASASDCRTKLLYETATRREAMSVLSASHLLYSIHALRDASQHVTPVTSSFELFAMKTFESQIAALEAVWKNDRGFRGRDFNR